MRKTLSLCFMALGLVASVTVSADVWDVQGDNDNSNGTDNELIHGADQLHDLGALAGPTADQDWFLMPQKRQSSYEATIESTSGDLGFSGLTFNRIGADGTTVVQTSGPAAGAGVPGYSRALRWANTTANTVNEFLRVGDGFCTTTCGADDIYRIRMVETTISIARFNNAGSQVTVLLTQNTTDQTINSTFFYWSTTGTLLQTGSLASAAKSLNIFNTSSLPALAGVGGSITIAHDGPYGGLNVKAVALEPSTGFSFDTPGVYRGY
jgi:hypothetical protein